MVRNVRQNESHPNVNRDAFEQVQHNPLIINTLRSNSMAVGRCPGLVWHRPVGAKQIPGFSGCCRGGRIGQPFQGLGRVSQPGWPRRKPLKRLCRFLFRDTRLKPGANEMGKGGMAHPVSSGTTEPRAHISVVPAGLAGSPTANPARKCWAIFGRPDGTPWQIPPPLGFPARNQCKTSISSENDRFHPFLVQF